MDETWKQIFTFLGTAGGVVFLTMVGNGIKKLWSGAATRERIKTTSLIRRTDAAEKKVEAAEKKVDDAQAEMEDERKLRLKAEYHVARLQHQVILLGAMPVKNDQDTEEKHG